MLFKRMIAAALAGLLLVASPTYAHQETFLISHTSVYDGDTFRAHILLGLGIVVADKPLRLDGIDTPEIGWRALCAEEHDLGVMAKGRLTELLSAETVFIRIVGTDKYGRHLTQVSSNGLNVVDTMIAEGLGREYHGGATQGWCQ